MQQKKQPTILSTSQSSTLQTSRLRLFPKPWKERLTIILAGLSRIRGSFSGPRKTTRKSKRILITRTKNSKNSSPKRLKPKYSLSRARSPPLKAPSIRRSTRTMSHLLKTTNSSFKSMRCGKKRKISLKKSSYSPTLSNKSQRRSKTNRLKSNKKNPPFKK